jgi:hypothetical protein
MEADGLVPSRKQEVGTPDIPSRIVCERRTLSIVELTGGRFKGVSHSIVVRWVLARGCGRSKQARDEAGVWGCWRRHVSTSTIARSAREPVKVVLLKLGCQ